MLEPGAAGGSPASGPVRGGPAHRQAAQGAGEQPAQDGEQVGQQGVATWSAGGGYMVSRGWLHGLWRR